MLIAIPVSRLAAGVTLAVLAVSGAATSYPARRTDVALTRASLIRIDAQAAREQAARLLPIDARASFKRLQLEVDDLLSASAVRNRAIQISAANNKTSSAKLNGQNFVPRGVDYHAGRGLVAIAAVSQVLLYAPATGEVAVVPGPAGGAFEFANDVVFDDAGGLVIADQGAETNAQEPRDGAIWRYDLDSEELVEIALKRELSNPKLLARDRHGVIHFIDGGSGARVSPVFDVRWDVLYRLQGRKLNSVQVVWGGAGIQATAYDMDRSGWHWIMNLGELVRIKGTKFKQPCLPPYSLQFATGLTITDSGATIVLDGADVLTHRRAIYTLDNACVATLSTTRQLKGARGLTHVPDE